MKKKITFSILITVIFTLLMFGMTSCTNKKTEQGTVNRQAADGQAVSGRPTNGNGKIGFSTITLGSEFFAALDDMVKARLESSGYQLITISAEGSPVKQVADIENLITMNCEAIFFFAMDPDAILDVLKRGRQAGIKMYGIACTIDDLDAYDKIVNTDQYLSGVINAQIAADWIEKTFPNAQDRSIEVALIVHTGSVDSRLRSDGMRTITEICSKAKVIGEYDLVGAADGNIKSQEFAEIMQGQFPNLKCVITYGTDSMLGANEAYMRSATLNRSEFAVFGVDTNMAIYEAIAASVSNGSLIRGTCSLGDDLSLDLWECLIDADLDYLDARKSVLKPGHPITPENVFGYLN